MKGFRVNMLGTFQCTYNGKAVDKLPKGKMQLFFAYLLLHMDVPIDRKSIAYMLWPESTDGQAQTNLRKLLHHFRKQVPAANDYLVLEDGQILWQARDTYVDTVEFMKLVDENGLQSLTKAESLYYGELLPGLHMDWVLQIRDELFMKYVGVIQKLVQACQRGRDYNQAIAYAQKLLRHDPLAENVHLKIMRLHVLNGHHSAAIRQYYKLKSLYNDELGLQPSHATKEFYTRCLELDRTQSSFSEPPPTFVGRYQEWEQLQHYWRQAKNKKACLVLIQGEKGIGKTHLLEQFLRWITVQGAAARISRCHQSEQYIPYETVIHWLEGIDLSELSGPYKSEMARLVPGLVHRYPELPQPEEIDNPWKLRYFYQAIEAALEASSAPLVLMIDDLQWADEETLSFLEYMMRPERKLPLLIVATSPTNCLELSKDVQAFIAGARRNSQLNNIQLGPLTETDTEQLMATLSLYNSEWDVRQVYMVSGGNPLYIQELFMHSGYSEKSERSNSTLRELMIRRLSSLPSNYRKVMDGLAVLGTPTSLPVIMHISSMPEGTIQESVDFLCQLRFLKQLERGLVEFFHDTVREAVLSLISPARKTFFHAKIAEVMKKNEHHEMYSAAEIAFHYDQSGNPTVAAPYYEQAAAKASAMYDHDQAMYYSKRLLKIYPSNKSCKPLSWLAHAHRMKGNLQQAEFYFRKLLEQCSGTFSIEDVAMVRVQLALCIRHQGNYHEALAMLESAARQLEWVDGSRGLVEVYRHMTTTYIHLGKFEQAHGFLELGRGDPTDQQDKYIYLGLKADLLYEKAMYDRAMDYYKQQIELANREAARIPLLEALFGLSLTYLETDQYAYAFESILECIRLTRSVQDQIGLGLAIGILGKIYLRAGWAEEAVPCLRYGLQQAQQSSDQRSAAIMTGLLGHAMDMMGKPEDAVLTLKEAERLSAKLKFPLFHGNSLYYLGRAHCAMKNWAEAQFCLDKALQIMVRDGRSDLLCKVRLLLLECSMGQGEVSVTEAIEQIQTWLVKYPLRNDQTLMHFTLWKLSEVEDVHEEAGGFIQEVYRNNPVPFYRGLLTTMKLESSTKMMDPPPLPEEVA